MKKLSGLIAVMTIFEAAGGVSAFLEYNAGTLEVTGCGVTNTSRRNITFRVKDEQSRQEEFAIRDTRSANFSIPQGKRRQLVERINPVTDEEEIVVPPEWILHFSAE